MKRALLVSLVYVSLTIISSAAQQPASVPINWLTAQEQADD